MSFPKLPTGKPWADLLTGLGALAVRALGAFLVVGGVTLLVGGLVILVRVLLSF